MILNLKQLENKKLNLIKEMEEIRKLYEESKDEEKNLNKNLTEMKNNYGIYLQKIQDMDYCMGANIERNIDSINIRKEVLFHKENYVKKMYIKNQNEFKEKEELINNEKIINRKKELELENIKKNLVIEKNELNHKSLELKQGFNNLKEQSKEKEKYFNSLEEKLEQEKNEIRREKIINIKEKKEIETTKKIIEGLFKDYYEKLEILKQREKEKNQERKQLEKDKMVFYDEVNNIRINKTLNNNFNK